MPDVAASVGIESAGVISTVTWGALLGRASAESQIRDVDMARESTNFTKHQILTQMGTAMLAQANALPQNVLQRIGSSAVAPKSVRRMRPSDMGATGKHAEDPELQ